MDRLILNPLQETHMVKGIFLQERCSQHKVFRTVNIDLISHISFVFVCVLGISVRKQQKGGHLFILKCCRVADYCLQIHRTSLCYMVKLKNKKKNKKMSVTDL